MPGKTERKKMGRKGKYEKWLLPENLFLITMWARDGLTEEQIAKEKIGISRKTLSEWKNKFSDFGNALKRGKEVADYEVENSLFKAAKEGNVTAMIFWLKNRRRDKWRDKYEYEMESNLGQIKDNIHTLKSILQSPAPDREIPNE